MLRDFQLSLIEAVGIELSTGNGPLIIIAAYCSVQSRDADGSSIQLRNDIQKLTRWRKNFILAGDLNARHSIWGNFRNNKLKRDTMS